MTGRATGLLTWRNNNFFNLIEALNIAAQYQGRNTSDRSGTVSNGDGYGFSFSYLLSDSFTILGTYSSSKRTASQQQLKWGHGDHAEVWAGGLKYDHDGLYLATLYSSSHNLTKISSSGYANKSNSYEAVASYQFKSGLKPFTGYFLSRAENVENIGKADVIKYLDIGLTFYLNKNMFVYGDYKINLLNDNNTLGIDSKDKIGIGMTYQV